MFHLSKLSSLSISLTRITPEPRGKLLCTMVAEGQERNDGPRINLHIPAVVHEDTGLMTDLLPGPLNLHATIGTWSYLTLWETVVTSTARVCCPWGILWLSSLASWSLIYFLLHLTPKHFCVPYWGRESFPAGLSDPTGMCSILYQSDFLHDSHPSSPLPFHWNYSFQVHWWPPNCPT